MNTVGDYQFSEEQCLGKGGFGSVYKGRHRMDPGNVVAIKRIPTKNMGSESFTQIQKEVDTMKNLRHANIVALRDVMQTANNVYLVMEYCNGGDLADYLRAKGRLSEDTIRLFLKQLAGAMSALYAKNIIHRDLKPQNIMLSRSSQGSIQLKIADFGLARFLPGSQMARTIAGTPWYMAPEMILSGPHDHKVDLWSLGVIVFECLTGEVPIKANSYEQLKNIYRSSQPVILQVPQGTSSALHDLLTRLLVLNPGNRIEFGEFFGHRFLR